MNVLILGGYGVFGGRLARLLVEDGHVVTVAGRSLEKARAYAEKLGATPLQLDSGDAPALNDALAEADVVVDAAGPFQAYVKDPYRVARAAIARGCHYLDLSDDATFTQGIAALQEDAKANGVAAISGLSSVPAFSAAAVRKGVDGLTDVALIESAILPGNRAPRGLSVMRAILSQAGEPLRLWRGGMWRSTHAWTHSKRIRLSAPLSWQKYSGGSGGQSPPASRRLKGGAKPAAISRPATFIGAPDLTIFPDYFRARSVLFRAGLELRVMHHGLAALALIHRAGLLPRLDRFATPLHRVASWLEGAGTDIGGMQVNVGGRTKDGAPRLRSWTLITEAGDGPYIPTLAVWILVGKLATGDVRPGARPALDDITLAEAEAALSRFAIQTESRDTSAPRLFEAALGAAAWDTLGPQQRGLHDVWDIESFTGTASVTRGDTIAARIAAAVFRFPPTTPSVAVRVTMERRETQEIWTRDFGGRCFRSVLGPSDPGHVTERFGAFKFKLALPVEDDGTMAMPVVGGRFLGLPIPQALLPVSEVRETTQDGVFCFNVRLGLPGGALLVHYQGTLRPEREAT